MLRAYNETALINFEDIRNLIREEVGKILDEVKANAAKGNIILDVKPLSIQQVADRYKVSKATIHNWMEKKTIKGFKMGKGRFFHIDELEKNLTKYRYIEVLESKGLVEKQKHLIV